METSLEHGRKHPWNVSTDITSMQKANNRAGLKKQNPSARKQLDMTFPQTGERTKQIYVKNRSKGPEVAFEENKQEASEVCWRWHRVQARTPAGSLMGPYL